MAVVASIRVDYMYVFIRQLQSYLDTVIHTHSAPSPIPRGNVFIGALGWSHGLRISGWYVAMPSTRPAQVQHITHPAQVQHITHIAQVHHRTQTAQVQHRTHPAHVQHRKTLQYRHTKKHKRANRQT